MYVVEGPENKFDNILVGIYWAIVTLTTVGYGDIVPHTVLGKFISSFLMIAGFGVLAVPTGIVSAEIVRSAKTVSAQACPSCSVQGHDSDAFHCKYCGSKL